MNYISYIQGGMSSGKSTFVGNIIYPVEEMKITASLAGRDPMFEDKLKSAIAKDKKYITIDGFVPDELAENEIDLIMSCIKKDIVLIITSLFPPPDWMKGKAILLYVSPF